MTADGPGALWLGINPEVAYGWLNSGNKWDGLFCLRMCWPDGYSRLWSEAGNVVQWHPKDSQRPTGKLSAIVWDAEQARKRNRL
jgi:hypothetical protein